jgi:HK97 gp10 family phage protein
MLRAPAGTILNGQKVGGRFISAVQAETSIAEMNAMNASGLSRGAVAIQPRFGYESRFPFVEAALGIRCHAAAGETAQMILEDAKNNLSDAGEHPYATGYLADSLELAELTDVGDWAVTTDVEYAPYVEFGSSHAPPHPYILPAVEAHRGDFINKEMAAVAEAAKATMIP